MRKSVGLALALGAALAPAAHAITITKTNNAADQWGSLNASSGSYVFADSFVAPAGTDVPATLGTWLKLLSGTPQSVRLEIWGDNGGPDHSAILATTGSVTPTETSSFNFTSFAVTSSPAALTPGTKYWFVITVVGEPSSGAYLAAAKHTQNSVYHDNGVFDASNDSSGVTFGFVNQTPEMAFQVGLSDVLLLDEQFCGSVSHDPAGLYFLTEPYNVTYDEAAFDDLLTSGIPWRVVLVDEYASGFSVGTETDLTNYIANGGHVGIDYWNWIGAPSFAATFDASYVSDFTTPLPIYQWESQHPLFTTPLQIPNPLDWTDDSCTSGTIDGAKFNPTSYGTTIAYFGSNVVAPVAGTPSPDLIVPPANDSAIIVGNGGRTVLFGGILGNYNKSMIIVAPVSESTPEPKGFDITNGEWMAENIADYLLHVIFVDGFESANFGAWSSETGGILLKPQGAAPAKH